MGWFENQIDQRRAADDQLLEDSFLKIAGVVLGHRTAEKIGDERIVTKNAIDEILKYYHFKTAELPENIRDTDAQLDILRQLQKAGFCIEMDDFGSGYSSLNLLREMPVDVLKIDMVFLQKAGENPRAETILNEVITMAGKLGITSLTEGVETKKQYDSLMEMGCLLYQGYYFARPMPMKEFEQYAFRRGRSGPSP